MTRMLLDKNGLKPGNYFGIITYSSTWVPGDERSRTHPGHGYPEHTIEHLNMEVYTDKAEWEAEIARRSAPDRPSWSRSPFTPLVFTVPTVSTSVTVSVG